jgi:hypothetical protein
MECFSRKRSRVRSRKGEKPSEMPYCSAPAGFVLKISAAILAISAAGKASGDGLPAASVTVSGSEGAFNISRMADGLSADMRLENSICFVPFLFPSVYHSAAVMSTAAHIHGQQLE